MRTRSQTRNRNRQQQSQPAVVQPFHLEEPFVNPPLVPMADNRTMAQLLQAPTEGYEDAIVIPEINANFELKHGLINLVQNKQFFGHDKEDPHAHIRYFNKITSTMRFPDVPSTSIKLMLFPFSLEGSARIWLEKEPPRSILTWDDLVSKFINQFFPPSKTTNLRNEITRFQQRFDESFYEAWDRFNDLLRACPHHGFSELHQLDTFYNALNANDQDSLNSAAGGNFLDKMPRECLRIIESKSKVRNSRNKAVVAKVSSNSSTPGISPDVAALTTEVSELKNLMKTMLIDKIKPKLRSSIKAWISSRVVFLPSVTRLPTEGRLEGYYTRVVMLIKKSTTVCPSGNSVSSSEPEVVQLVHRCPNPKQIVSIPYPSRQNDERHRENANKQKEKFYEIFNDMSFEISFMDALTLMPKFTSTLKALIANKEKLSSWMDHFDTIIVRRFILNKLPEKLGDPGRFLIPCKFPGMDECLALADLGASINLMPFSMWEKSFKPSKPTP
ncbi:reverse transcriptase domain-containing protein [Tanacetum coccineum]